VLRHWLAGVVHLEANSVATIAAVTIAAVATDATIGSDLPATGVTGVIAATTVVHHLDPNLVPTVVQSE
jgi:hypothetical protein